MLSEDLEFFPSYDEMLVEKERSEREARINTLFANEFEKLKAELGRNLTDAEYDELRSKARKTIEEKEGVAKTDGEENLTETAKNLTETAETLTESEENLTETVEPEEKTWKELEKKQRKYQHELQLLALNIQTTESSIVELKSQLKDEKDILKGYYKRLLNLTKKGVDNQLEMDLPAAEKPEEKSDEDEDETPSDDWKKRPVSDLDLTDHLKAKLAENFETCGEVCDWVGSDYTKKIKGL